MNPSQDEKRPDPRSRVLIGFSTNQAQEAGLGATSVDELQQMIDHPADSQAKRTAEKIQGNRAVHELPPEMIPKNGFLGDVINYWRAYNEASDTFLLASALATLAVASGKGTGMVDGDSKLWLNLWSVIVGPSTAGRKSTALRLPKALADRASLEPFSFPRCTAEGLIGIASGKEAKGKEEAIPAQTFGLWTEDEFAELNSLIEKEYNSGLKSGLLGAYDGGRVDVYSRGLGRQTARFEGLTILSATTPERLGFNQEDHSSGWMGRWLFWPSSKPSGRSFPMRRKPDLDLQRELCGFLVRVRFGRELKFLDDAEENYCLWYRAEQGKPVPEALASNWQRHQTYVKKLACLKALSEDLFHVRSEDVFWAIELIDWQRRNLKVLVRDEEITGFAKLQKRFLDFLIRNGGQATRKEVCRNLSVKIADLTDVIETLKEAGRLSERTRTNEQAKPSIVYLLADDPDDLTNTG